MKQFIFRITLLMSLLAVGAQAETIDNSDCESTQNPCIGEYVIGYRSDGTVKTGKLADINHRGFKVRYTTNGYLYADSASKEVSQLQGVISKKDAITSAGERVYIEHIFADGAVKIRLSQYNPNSGRAYTDVNSIFNKCFCVGDVCSGQSVVAPNGRKVRIDEVYQNGAIFEFKENALYPYEATELGLSLDCSEDAPCACTK